MSEIEKGNQKLRCPHCGSTKLWKHQKTIFGKQQYLCGDCHKTTTKLEECLNELDS